MSTLPLNQQQASALGTQGMSPLLLYIMMQQAQQQPQQQVSETPGSGLKDIISLGKEIFGGNETASKAIPEAVGTAKNGGTLMSDGSIANAPGFMSNLGTSSLGTLPGALGAVGAGFYLNNIYEGGAKDIMRGKGKSEDYTNLMLDVNPVTAPINMISRAFGGKSIGKKLFGRDEGTQNRKSLIKNFNESGFLNNGKINFSDGTSFDLTREKKYLKNQDGSERQGFDLDENDPFQRSQIGRVDAISQRIMNGKKSTDKIPGYEHLTRYIINAATQGTRDQKIVDARIKEIEDMVSGNRKMPEAAQPQPQILSGNKINKPLMQDKKKLDLKRIF